MFLMIGLAKIIVRAPIVYFKRFIRLFISVLRRTDPASGQSLFFVAAETSERT
jgi:hypothetical protein